MTQLDPALFYDFNKLASICKDLDFQYEQLSADEFKIFLRDDIYLGLINLGEGSGPTTLIYMDEEQHTHGIDFDLGTYCYTSIHYLDIPLLLRTGEVLVYERYYNKILGMRWLAHCTEITNELENLESGDEVRIIRL